MWAGSSGLPPSSMILQVWITGTLSKFTAGGSWGKRGCGWRTGSDPGRGAAIRPSHEGVGRLWGQGWARTGVSGFMGWDLQTDIWSLAIGMPVKCNIMGSINSGKVRAISWHGAPQKLRMRFRNWGQLHTTPFYLLWKLLTVNVPTGSQMCSLLSEALQGCHREEQA